MITYTEKGIKLHKAIVEAGYSIARVDGVWITSDDVAVQAIIDSFDYVASLKEDKRDELKTEGLTRIQQVMPAIQTFDDLQLVKEQYLSVKAASRSATTAMQSIIDIYTAGVAGIAQINALTTEADVLAFDVVNDVAW